MTSPAWLAVIVLGLTSFALDPASTQDAKTFRVQSKSGQIQVISDRDESIPAYFQRHRIVVAGMLAKELKQCLTADKTLDKQFVNYASFNDDAERRELFGATLHLAVTNPTAVKLVRKNMQEKDGKEKPSITLILRADGQAKDTYHIVGFTTATSVSFFADGGFAGDGLRAAELRYQPVPK